EERERVRIVINDKDGKLVRELNGTKEAGLNRVLWDLRARSINVPEGGAAAAAGGGEAAETAEGGEQAGFGGGFGFGGGGGALRVEPGTYTVKVTLGKNEQSKIIVVEEDPRITISAEERASRRHALTQLSQMTTTATTNQRSMTGLRTSLSNLLE